METERSRFRKKGRVEKTGEIDLLGRRYIGLSHRHTTPGLVGTWKEVPPYSSITSLFFLFSPSASSLHPLYISLFSSSSSFSPSLSLFLSPFALPIPRSHSIIISPPTTRRSVISGASFLSLSLHLFLSSLLPLLLLSSTFSTPYSLLLSSIIPLNQLHRNHLHLATTFPLH
ncbi:hypothetical protein BDV59DRAFT_54888 [Aspergillus ambiguus]|uniref:uncharacterized protein n=1 Tax=Aspergillus ambiguus TaxID=176160 RepID=UPI003CCD247A